MKTDVPESVDDYIEQAADWAKPVLRELRAVIRQAAPEARESISYRMPYYSHNGRLAYFGAYTNHCSFHWISEDDKQTFAEELSKVTVVGSTLQITRGERVPASLISAIVKSRLKQRDKKE